MKRVLGAIFLFYAAFGTKIELKVEFSESGFRRTSFPVDGGAMDFKCSLEQPKKLGEEVWIECTSCIDETRRACSRDNDTPIRTCSSRVNAKDWPFGDYRCAWNRLNSNVADYSDSFSYAYRQCDEATACHSCNKTHPWCLIVPSDNKGNETIVICFSKWNLAECPKTDFVWCPSGATVCEGLDRQNLWNLSWARYSGIDECPKGENAYVSYNGKKMSFREAFPIRREIPTLKLVLPPRVNDYEFGGALYRIEDSDRPGGESCPLNATESNIKLEKCFHRNGSEKYLLDVSASYRGTNGTIVSLSLSNWLIFIDTELTVDINSTAFTAHCKPKHPTGHGWFMVVERNIWWSRGNRIFKQPYTFADNDSVTDVFCHLNVSYRSCSPIVDWWAYSNHSLKEALVKTLKDAPSGKLEKPNEQDTTAEIGYVIGGVMAGLLVIGGVAFVAFKLYKKRKRTGHNKELQATLRDEQNVMDVADVRKMACEMIGSEEPASEMISSLDTCSKREEADAQDVETVPNCRHPEIPLRSSTKVTVGEKAGERLHMTKMKDFHGHTLLLSQSPKIEQFESHLTAIWKERVGTVVISTEAHEGKESKWEESFSPQDGGRRECGKFVTVTEACIKSPGEFDQFSTVVSLSKEKRSVKRRITFIRVDASVMPSKLVELLEMVQRNQDKKIGERLPGILFQCPTGIHRSATLLTSFIERQIWMRYKRVNLLGLLRYVRRHRHGVFSGKDGAQELRLVAGMMQIISTRTEMGDVGGLTVEAHERDVFDRRARQNELAELATSAETASEKSLDSAQKKDRLAV